MHKNLSTTVNSFHEFGDNPSPLACPNTIQVIPYAQIPLR